MFNSHESYNVINKTIEFILMYKIWTNQNVNTFINSRTQNTVIFKIFAILINNNIIIAETIYISWLKKNQTNYKSIFFIHQKILKIYNKPLSFKKIKNYCVLYGDHYSSYWDMYIPNIDSNSIFDLKEESIVESMLNMKTHIDFELLTLFYELYIKHNNLNTKTLKNMYSILINELKLCIKYNNKELCASVSKQLAITQKAIDLKFLLDLKLDEKNFFYLPWKYDFRGRIYFFSDISFTFNKEFRWCMYSGFYNKIEDYIPQWHYYNQKIYKILDNYLHLIDNSNLIIKNKNNVYIKYILIFLLISLGEINKTKLGVSVNINNFIVEGLKIYNEYNINSYDYDEIIKILSIKKIILDFEKNLETEKIKKRLISKDAPASVFQHLILNFGWKNGDLLKWCNLNSNDTWYDTYSFLIEEWKKKQIKNDIISSYFNRKNLKKTIMTSNYGVGLESAEKYFEEMINSENKNIENWKEIKILFRNFFTYLINLELAEKSPKEIISYIEKNNGFIELSDANIDANYYIQNDCYIIDFLIEGSRYTKYFKLLSEKKNKKKFEIAIRANYIQSLDAALVRWVINKKQFYSIHDCFLVDFGSMVYFLSLVNEGMNEKFHDFHKTWEKEKTEIFSIFIVL